MSVVIGLVPALCWGIFPLVAQKLGGKPVNQILGTTLGAFLLGAAVFLWRRPQLDGTVFWFCFLSGACWALGQILQYTAFTEIGAARALPVSSGMQLFGNALLGVLALGEWPILQQKLLGFGALAVIIVGAAATTWRQDKTHGGGNMRKALGVLALSTLGYVGYSAFPRFVSADGWAEFFPQTVGMLATALVLAMFMTRGRAYLEKTSRTNVLSGLIFAVGALGFSREMDIQYVSCRATFYDAIRLGGYISISIEFAPGEAERCGCVCLPLTGEDRHDIVVCATASGYRPSPREQEYLDFTKAFLAPFRR